MSWFKDKKQSTANNFKTKHNKSKKLLANASLFTIQHLQSNLNEFTGYGIYIYLQNNGLILQKRLHSLKEQMNR
jgi:hypothetical protein